MKRSSPANPQIAALLQLLDEAYEKQAWHGPNLRGSLRGIEPAQAAWRPAAGRKNIWEIALHAAYWKYACRRRLAGEKRGSFPLKGSSWFERGDASDERQWVGDLALLERMHRELRAVVAAYPPTKLLVRIAPTKHTPLRLIQGVALHDVYHTGQIQTLKRLYSQS
ncbi:MAG TPA: DinB family protein [Pirellulaceae bacterium]|nr:DinB family protein [Pirellulaceae bacterium]